MMRKLSFALSVLALAALQACGGGGSSADPFGGTTVATGSTVTFLESPPQQQELVGGQVFQLRAVPSSVNGSLVSAVWTSQAQAGGSPSTLPLQNEDCAQALKLENASTGTGAISSSRWECVSTSVAPVVKVPTIYDITLTAKNNSGNTGQVTARIVVNPPTDASLAQRAPVVVAPALITTSPGQQTQLVCSGQSPVGAALTYTWTQVSGASSLPWTLTDTAKATALVTPPANAESIGVFQCEVKDAQGFASAALVQVVSSRSSLPAPVVAGASAAILAIGTDNELACNASGGYVAPGSALKYQWVVDSNPSGLQIGLTDALTSKVKVRVASLPTGVNTANATLVCRVTDDALRTVTASFPVTFTQVPTTSTQTYVQADAGTQVVTYPGQTVRLDGSRSALIGGTATSGSTASQLFYRWRQISGSPMVSLSGATTVSPSFTAPVTASRLTLGFELVASSAPISDTYTPKTSERATVDVVVNAIAAPQVTVDGVTTATSNAATSITARMNNNPLSLPVFYRWSQISGPAVTIQQPNSQVASFFAPAVVTVTDLVLRVQASFDATFPASATSSVDAQVRVSP